MRAASRPDSTMTQPALPNDDPKPAHRLGRATAALALVALAAFLALSHRGLPGLSAETHPAEPDKPLLVRDGNRISLPPDSPIRAKLAVEPVVEKEIEQKLVL